MLNDSTPAENRLIVALDFNNAADALRLVDRLAGTVSFFKVGLELFVAGGREVVRSLLDRNLRAFLDLKMNDIPETVARAVRQAASMGVDFLTILGDAATMKAAAEGRGDSTLRILCVTVLTSVSEQDLGQLGLVGPNCRFKSLDEYVLWRAELALEQGCDGLITSGENVAALRERFRAARPLLVCPGIRPQGAALNDQKRPSTPYNAIVAGADYLVVGRPIRDAGDPKKAAEGMIGEISTALGHRPATPGAWSVPPVK
ncbi:MAG: orotidine-5'-phosphate decarboxylase [Candidatus Hydrogenedentes bacterium]|nr:orotidine-5'-phosphate decarboxylase [Candidatus Hydrogenedentota bacterium]